MIIEPDSVNPHEEPCLVCGEETAAGSVFFSDRREAQLQDGTRGFLCSLCVRRLRKKHGNDIPSDARLVEGAAIVLTGGWL